MKQIDDWSNANWMLHCEQKGAEKLEASTIVTRRCDAAGLNASGFIVLKSRTIYTVCIVSACARVARCTLVERA